VVASGLQNPWEVTWGPDNMLWVTERTGKRVTRIDPSNGARSVAIQIDEISAPGGQEGMLGLAMHPELLKGSGKDFVYVSYTYVDKAKGAHPEVADPNSPYRYLYLKIVRLTYNASEAKLANPVEVLKGLPAGNDHVGGRLKLGPDGKLYMTIGDQGHNQLGNFCLPVEAQRLPLAREVQEHNYSAYVGKTLRINPDGSVPADNPKLHGVVSHVFTYGHRNTQGIDFAPDGVLYGGEHGPKTDYEINVITSGGNYGWPHVAGMKDNKAYEYARWAEASTPCSELRFSDLQIHPSVPREPESAYREKFTEPIATLFTVPTGYRFDNPACKGIDFICWPTVAISSIEHYQAGPKGIPGWDRVLLVTTLKRGSLYVVPLAADGKSVSGRISRYFQSENRYRDTAVNPDRRTIYIATDSGGVVESLQGGVASKMHDPGSILAFTYTGEGSGEPALQPSAVSETRRPDAGPRRPPISGAIPPQFTAAQVAAGRTAYNASCAVCHGSTLRNGTMGTPLAGEYFQGMWSGRAVRELFDRVHKTMPPASPGSLSRDAYAAIISWILEVNGAKSGAIPLSADSEAMEKMAIP
jgi:PQQ-dependent dehydrogenase (s-GDH family)